MRKSILVGKHSNTNTKLFTRTPIIEKYLTDIRKYQIPTISEEEDIVYRIKNGDEKAKQELIIRNQRFVYTIAKQFAKNSTELMELVSEANIGLVECVDEFEPERGFKFISFAIWYIRKYIMAYILKKKNLVTTYNHNKCYNKIQKIRNEFLNKYEYEPSLDYIFEQLKEKYDITIKNKTDLYEYIPISIDTNIDDDDYTFEDSKIFNEATAQDNTYIEKVENEYNVMLLNNFLNKLKPRYRDLIIKSYGLCGSRVYTNEELSELYHSTVTNVTATKRKALEKLKELKKEVLSTIN